MKKLLLVLVAAAFLSACATKEQTGQIIGGTIGGIIGNTVGGGSGRVLATGIGVIAGIIIGGNIGKHLDNYDKQRIAYALEHGSSNQTSTWKNPDTGNYYEVTPKPAHNRNNQVCREYRTIGYIGGKKEEIVGTACRQSDGSWRTQ